MSTLKRYFEQEGTRQMKNITETPKVDMNDMPLERRPDHRNKRQRKWAKSKISNKNKERQQGTERQASQKHQQQQRQEIGIRANSNSTNII
ncbi:hypothetical protein CHS0354_017822 [Potamilus streckersoni]|uniref:Uncharacterized protein n=1 Tax=Potamilus streckersoni TaxID=2493646 RepID=A0AAE0T8S9_9BIVA|nr:hypothetical protein CHS0354_017822 [Potamilus streckersoni]